MKAIFTALFLFLLSARAAKGTICGSCRANIDASYEFTNVDLAWINPHLKNDPPYRALRHLGCSDSRPDGQVCFDKPSIGSGLAQFTDNCFIGLTDRGPNQDCEDLFEANPKLYREAAGKKGKAFPLLNFTPSLVHFAVRPGRQIKGKMMRRKSVLLRGSKGQLISGLPNTADDDVAYAGDCKGKPLPLDPSGLDTEDLALIPNSDYAVIVDEYAPSVLVVNHKTGIIQARHVPKNKVTQLAGAKYPIVGDIPAVFSKRRKNKGFEGVVVDSNGKYAIAILQSPMFSADTKLSDRNRIIRCAYFDIVSQVNGVPKLRYKRSFVIETSPTSSYFYKKNKPKTIKYSGAQHHSDGKFIVLERAKKQVKLFLVDFSEVTNIDTTKYADNLGLEKDTNGERTAKSLGIIAADKTLIWDSAPGAGGTNNWHGTSSKQESFVIDKNDPTKVWMMDDNDFGLKRAGNTKLLQISLGRNVNGASICPAPRHPPSPSINTRPSKAIRLVNSQTYRISSTPGIGAAENLDVDERGKLAYVVNDANGTINTYDISSVPTPIESSVNIPGFSPTSTNLCDDPKLDRLAVALANSNSSQPGLIQIVSRRGFKIERTISNKECFLPDALYWSADCSYLVVACEGEGADVPGGVLVIDFDNESKSYRGDTFASFTAYDAFPDELWKQGIRLIESNKASLDLQPEYVTIIGKSAFVVLQEANAIAVVDMAEAKITELKPIGFIDRSRPGFGLDASDIDGGINIRNYPLLFGMPQPDAISSYTAKDGKKYLVFANEGDALDSEESLAGDLKTLNRTFAPGLRYFLENTSLLGRLKVTKIDGYNPKTNVQHAVYHFGGRSFSIMEPFTGEIVFDSGEWFARIMEDRFPQIFQADDFEFDGRSDDKGGEPESVALLTTSKGTTYAFIGLERSNIIVAFDISNPRNPTFVDAVQNNPLNLSQDDMFRLGKQGDIDPEGLFASSVLRKLIVAGSESSTVSSYDIKGL